MSEVLTVPTHFNDLSELSTGLVDRVGEGSLILYGPVAYAQGDEVAFAVLLADETPAIEGVGRVEEVYDGGDERDPETRYDIVFEALQLDGRSEVVFERIVLARQSMLGDDPNTGEVDISEFEEPPAAPDFDDSTEFVGTSEAEHAGAFDDATVDGSQYSDAIDGEAAYEDVAAADDIGSYEDVGADFDDVGAVQELGGLEAVESLPEPADVAPPQMAVLAEPAGPLGRPVFAASWWPRAEAPEPRPSTGWFQYAAGSLPVPGAPPRPELSPEQRVSPAPRPDPNAPAEPSQPPPRKEMDLPGDDAEIAPAVESDYVSVGDAVPVDDVPDPSAEAAPPEAEAFDAPAAVEPAADEAVDEPAAEQPATEQAEADEANFSDVVIDDEAPAEPAGLVPAETEVEVDLGVDEPAAGEDEFSFAGVAEAAEEAALEPVEENYGADDTVAVALDDADDGFDVDFDDDSLNA
ncbi:MAG: hypothetical protein AAF411_21350 [Myxococcota bacterium]